MAIVRFDRSYKVCATCINWQGKRQIENGSVVFNNRDTGACKGSSFNGWTMGATSTCLEWFYQDEQKNGASLDTHTVKEMTLEPPV